MARDILRRDQLWPALEREQARAETEGPSPDAVHDDASAHGQASPYAPPAPVIEASAPVTQAEDDAQPPPAPVDLEAVEPSVPRETDAAAIARLAAMGQLDYDRVRRQEAEALGVTLQALDAEVRAARARQAQDADGAPFADPVPWPSRVVPERLFNVLANVVHRYLVLDEAQVVALVLWIIHTYLTELFEVSPLVLFTAPEKASGKSTAQALVARLCRRPLLAANASPSSIFRAVEKWGPTLLIDEADTFFRDRPELHGLVNAGYSRGGFVLRTEAAGDGFEPRAYSVYGAKSIAGNNLDRHLPDATMSRGIVIKMRRRLPHEKVERLRDADRAAIERIRRMIVRFAVDYGEQIRRARPKLPDTLSDRAMDIWEVLVAIASCAAGWTELALDAASKLSGPGESQASLSTQLLEDIRRILDRRTSEKISTVHLIEALCADEERPWATYNRGKPITPLQLARLLAGFGIKSKTVRLGPNNTPKGYERAQFDDAFARYLAPAQGPSEDGSVAEAERQQQFFRIDPLGSEPNSEAGDDWPAPPDDDPF